jgi:ABC-type polysaccharide/polyol phosphate transport system ATPase subunit
MMSATPSIRLDRVSLNYPLIGAKRREGDSAGSVGSQRTRSGIEALHAVSFELGQGEKLGLIGHNGSGKTTLLKVLAGVLHPNEGEMEIRGEVAALFNLGVGVRADATGERNIILRGLAQGLSLPEAKAKIAEITEFTGLQDYIDLPVRTYSAGMQMRLIFALATAFGQDILILDEWIGAGDAAFAHKVAGRLDALVHRAGITVLASHRPALIKQQCTQALWLERGRVRALGPASEIVDAYVAETGSAAPA